MSATRPLGIGGHQSAAMGRDEWLTPPVLLCQLGDFDLDPCAPIDRPWRTAAKHYTVEDNGLAQPWEGRVWLNPPYGQHTGEKNPYWTIRETKAMTDQPTTPARADSAETPHV